MVKCDICGREFDSERGLHIHQSQKHEEEDEGSESSTGTSNTDSEQEGVNLSVRQFGGITFIFGLLLGVFAGGVGYAVYDGGFSVPFIQSEDTQSGDSVNVDKIQLEGEPTLGDKDAKVTMIIYEDYQCPFCKRFEENTMPQIKENYVDTGKVKVVWKDYPAPGLGHDWAVPAAEAMECVYRQDNDAFWNVKDEIFSQAKTLTRGEDEFTPDNIQERIIGMAENESVSGSDVQSCIESNEAIQEIQNDRNEIDQLADRVGTPTVFVGDEKVVGAQPYSRFKSVIEQELNN